MIISHNFAVASPSLSTSLTKPESIKQSESINQSEFLDFSNDATFGSEQARFVFIEYADYQCPYCKQFHQVLLKWFSNDYPNSDHVKWVFRHNPILGKQSLAKAQSAICVLQTQGNDAFWRFNDLLYTQPIKASENLNIQQSLWLASKKLDLDIKAIIECETNNQFHTLLNTYQNQSNQLNIQSTPTWYFVDLSTGKVIVGSGSINIDQLNALVTNSIY